MKREFLLNILFLVFINLLIKPFYIFGIDRTVQNTLEAGEYGLYFALFNFTYLFQIINDAGIQHFNNRNIAQYNQLLVKYFPNILILKGILGIIYLCLVCLIAHLSGYTFEVYWLIGLIGINQILTSLVLFLRSNISGLALYRLDSIISILDKLLMILICGILLWNPVFKGEFKLEWFVFAQMASLGVTALIAFIILRNRLKKVRIRFNPAFLWLILKKSYPYALVIFLMTIYTRIDGVMIERMLPNGKLEADIYASAYRLLDASNMIGFLFATLLFPMFSRMIKEKEPVGDLVRFSLQFIWSGAITLALASFFFQEEIMTALYVEGNAYSGKILGYLMLCFIAISGSYIYGTLITVSDHLKMMNYISVIGVLINIVLNLILIPRYQALGAALATVVTQFFILFLQIILAKKLFHLKWDWKLILQICFFSGGLILLGLFPVLYTFDRWIISFSLFLLIGFALALLCRLIDIKNILQMLQFEQLRR